MVKIYKQPFAHGGDAIAIPDASQPDGKMSNADGWTPDYQLPKTDPNYKPVGRQEMNGVFKEVTESLGQVQVQGAASWSLDGTPYPINAQVYHGGKQWIALRANSVEPAEGEDWTEFGAAVIGNKLDKSAVVQTTGASTTDIMSQKAVSDQLLGVGQTWQDLSTSRREDTIYTNTTDRTIAVAVSGPLAGDGGKSQIQAYVDGIQVARSAVGYASFGDGANSSLFFLVPSGATYKIIIFSGEGTLYRWTELR